MSSRLLTLPTIATERRLPLDRLREMLRTDKALAALGARVGATRVFTVEEADVIEKAFEAVRLRKSEPELVA